MWSVLKITDGTEDVNLLSGADGFVLDKWVPATPDKKSGGIWRNSLLTDGRRLVARALDNTIETFALKVSSTTQVQVITATQRLRGLLEQAAAYWTSNGRTADPVWIEARAECESFSRYALIMDARAPQDSNPYDAPFFNDSGLSEIPEFPLIIERGHWLSAAPLTADCTLANNYKYTNTAAAATAYNTGLAANAWPYSWDRAAVGSTVYAVDSSYNIYSTADHFHSWTLISSQLATIGAGYSAFNIMVAPNGHIFWVSQSATPLGDMWRSTDGGVTFSKHAVTAGNVVSWKKWSDGSIWYSSFGQTVPQNECKKSTDNGATWQAVALPYTSEYFHDFIEDLTDPQLARYCMGSSGNVWKTVDNGVTWELKCSLILMGSYTPRKFLVLQSGRWLAINAVGVWYTDDKWTTRGVAALQNFSIGGSATQTSDGLIFARNTTGTGSVMVSADDGMTWSTYFQDPASTQSASLFGTDIDEVGWAHTNPSRSFYLRATAAWRDVGNESACSDNLPVANRSAGTAITHVIAFDASAGTYTEKYPFTSFPVNIQPSPSAAGDYVYIGSETMPIYGFMLDLAVVPAETYWYFDWYYWNGAAWAALSSVNTIGSYTTPGTIIHSAAAAMGTTKTTVNGISAYWLRLTVKANTEMWLKNIQLQAVDNNFIEINASGDLPALLRLQLLNISDLDGSGGSQPNAWFQRAVIGRRSVARGADFASALNISDVQADSRVTVTAGTNVSFAAATNSAVGRLASWSAQIAETTFADKITFTFSPAIARQFYGTYRVFLRANCLTSWSYSATATFFARLVVRSGSGGVTTYGSKEAAFSSNYTDSYEAHDLGRITIPANGLFNLTDVGDQMQLVLQMKNGTGVAKTVTLWDLVLIPVDEWSGDFIDTVNSTASFVGAISSGLPVRHYLDVDSATDPQTMIKALVRKDMLEDQITAVYQAITGAPVTADPDSAQRFYFFFARATTQSIFPWVNIADQSIAASVQVQSVQRFLSMRGEE